MRIGHKVVSGFVIMGALVAVVGGYSLTRHYDSLHQIDQIIHTNTHEIELTEKIDGAIQSLKLNYLAWIFETQVAQHPADIAKAREGVKKNILDLNESLLSLEQISRMQMAWVDHEDELQEIKEINDLKRRSTQFDAINEQLGLLLNSGAYLQAHQLLNNKINPLVAEILSISFKLRIDASNEMKNALVRARDDTESNITLTIQLVIGVLLAAILFGLLLSRGIMSRIVKLKQVTEEIGSGHLDSRVDSLSGDEIGDIAQSINSMAKGLRKAIVSRDDLVREIRIREIAEVEHSKSEAKFHTIFDASADVLFLLDDVGVLDCNSASLGLFEYSSKEQLIGQHLADLSPEVQLDGSCSQTAACERIDEAYKEGSIQFEWICKKSSGEEFSAEVLLTSTILNGGDLLLASIRDISERKFAERALKASEERTRLLLDSTAEAIYGIDRDGLCFLANASCLEILGYEDHSELIGKNMHELIHHSRSDGTIYPIDECPVYRALETGEESHVDDEVIWRKNGSYFPASYWTHPIYKGDKIAGSVVTFLDISETIKTKQDLKQSHEYLRVSLEGTVSAVAKAVEARDPYTSGHQNRVAEIAVAIAHEMGLDSDRIKGIYLGAIIHDIGKIQTPAELLSKPSRLTGIEYSLIQTHAQTGYDILKDVAFPWPIALIAQQHHERVDGSGYPHGLKGEEICLEARIVAVADVVEAMSNHRPYRAGLGIDRALDEIRTNRGTHYDADVADACLLLFTAKGFFVQTS
ncbi:HD domain-containing phosphohydrolase [Mariprofundus sp. KV]|uniref:HD domain-containing phosphohydrolase n=1 Tax=Mariprofundus sp. KV TaxID=2608715 RepID=UPI0015A16692|nr:HD domain-containing phosphohydrolase [Mariprofundus sp. KV]NWF36276.1 PAS domain S-box protein [Mariprofundus sp. KV]